MTGQVSLENSCQFLVITSIFVHKSASIRPAGANHAVSFNARTTIFSDAFAVGNAIWWFDR